MKRTLIAITPFILGAILGYYAYYAEVDRAKPEPTKVYFEQWVDDEADYSYCGYFNSEMEAYRSPSMLTGWWEKGKLCHLDPKERRLINKEGK